MSNNNTTMSTDSPTIDIPEYCDLTTEQALAIIEEWGTPAIDVDPERGTASVSTPPMSVEQIAVIVLRAAQRATSVSAYVQTCARNNGSNPAPDVVHHRVASQGSVKQYRARMAKLQRIIEDGVISDE